MLFGAGGVCRTSRFDHRVSDQTQDAMRTDISVDRIGWLHALDYKKLIIFAFLLRVIFASGYEVLTAFSGKDMLVPDSEFYSVCGSYMASYIDDFKDTARVRQLFPVSAEGKNIFYDLIKRHHGYALPVSGEMGLFPFIIGIIYSMFGYVPVAVKIFNICLSIASAYFIFRIAKRHFGNLAANIFLIAALFLPTELGYSLTMCRDLMRVFAITFILWVIYG